MPETRILWVEDTWRDHPDLIKDLLRNYHVCLNAAETNESGLQRARENRWNIVFYDIGMDDIAPGDVLPVANKIRRLVRPAPIIGITYNDASFYSRLKGNFDDIIQSGMLELEDIVRIIQRYHIELTAK